MGFKSWFCNLFHHINVHNLAGGLAVAQQGVVSIVAVEDPNAKWLPDFSAACQAAVTALSNWQTGQPTTQIAQAITSANAIVSAIPTASTQVKEAVAVYTTIANEVLAFAA